ncbi:hypothetical protein [Algoriphagus sp. NG3]|uniref:hypothetical protein n=1 Tax=Algoriphagus sp. NG3 TaxID=3097546 RepID=UPI002A8082D7|nr:hypothetical protein [Algoriphagus sp. NG3]WPR74455.1 hypothetical protein SLW71_17465 [Algoriphagus sp. NG3]
MSFSQIFYEKPLSKSHLFLGSSPYHGTGGDDFSAVGKRTEKKFPTQTQFHFEYLKMIAIQIFVTDFFADYRPLKAFILLCLIFFGGAIASHAQLLDPEQLATYLPGSIGNYAPSVNFVAPEYGTPRSGLGQGECHPTRIATGENSHTDSNGQLLKWTYATHHYSTAQSQRCRGIVKRLRITIEDRLYDRATSEFRNADSFYTSTKESAEGLQKSFYLDKNIKIIASQKLDPQKGSWVTALIYDRFLISLESFVLTDEPTHGIQAESVDTLIDMLTSTSLDFLLDATTYVRGAEYGDVFDSRQRIDSLFVASLSDQFEGYKHIQTTRMIDDLLRGIMRDYADGSGNVLRVWLWDFHDDREDRLISFIQLAKQRPEDYPDGRMYEVSDPSNQYFGVFREPFGFEHSEATLIVNEKYVVNIILENSREHPNWKNAVHNLAQTLTVNLP